MPEIYGKNEAEIEEHVHGQLQAIAKEATNAAVSWANGWQNGRVTVTRKVINALNDRLELMLQNTLSPAVVEKATQLATKEVAAKFTEEYIRSHAKYEQALKLAEEEFWRDFGYTMRDSARKAGERAAQQTSQAYETSMTILIKNAVLDHFAASDGMAELAAEGNR